MKSKSFIKRITSLLLCICLALPGGIGVFANSPVTVAFMGNAVLENELMTAYSTLIGNYIEERIDSPVNIVTGAPVDFESKGFMNSLAEDIIPANPDIVFIELNISKRYKATEAVLTEKLESILKTLGENGNPAVYFIYTPDEHMRDNRKPFERLAKHYGIKTIDAFDHFNIRYKNGQMSTRDFLTAGLIPSEEAHKTIAELVNKALAETDDIFASKLAETKPLTKASYTASFEEEEVKPEQNSDGTVLYVSGKNGNDHGAGTIDAPLRTIEGARDRIRFIKKQQGKNFKGATVYIRGGLYQLEHGITFDENDSGTETGRIVYQGYNDEEVRFTTANVLDGTKFKPVRDVDTLNRLSTMAIGKVYEFDLKSAKLDPGTFIKAPGVEGKAKEFDLGGGAFALSLGNMLAVNGRESERAQYPNGGGYAVVADHSPGLQNEFGYALNGVENWQYADQAYGVIMGSFGYTTSFVRVDKIDVKSRMVYLIRNSLYAIKPGWCWGLTNMLETLDCPGEWVADTQTEKLYYYPQGDLEKLEILFATNPEPVFSMKKTTDVTFKNITVESSIGTGLEIYEGKNVTVDGCTFKNLGYLGIDVHHQNSPKAGNVKIINSEFFDIASTAVVIREGDRINLTPSNDLVENCHFDHYAKIEHNDAAAVATQGTVGVAVRHCNIHNDDSSALFMGGNDDLFEYNELYNVCKDTDDYGVIYGDYRGLMRQGVTLKNNFVHDCISDLYAKDGEGSVMGFYSDAQRNNGANVYNNVFMNMNRTIYISNNQNMTVSGNLIFDSQAYSIGASEDHYDKSVVEKYEMIHKELSSDGNEAMMKYRGMGETAFKNSTGGSPLFYRGWLSETAFTEENKHIYYLKYPWMEQYIDRGTDTGGFSLIENNAMFGEKENMRLPDSVAERYTVRNNYISKDGLENEETVDRINKAMEIAKEKLGSFEVWDVTKTGMYGEPTPIKDFKLLGPANDAKNVPAQNLRLSWEIARGADEYEVFIATDKEFKNVIFTGTTKFNFIDAPDLSSGSKRYYWKVMAKSYSTKFTGTPWNLDGVYSFVTSRYPEPDRSALYDLVILAEEALAKMTEGDEAGQYPAGSKEKLEEALKDAMSVLDNKSSNQNAINSKTEEFKKIALPIMASARFEEISAVDVMGTPELATGINGKDIAGIQGVTFENSGIQAKHQQLIFSKNKLETYQVLRGTMKFLIGPEYPGYTLLCLRATANNQSYVWNLNTYAILVNSKNIELQAFRLNDKLYMAVENTYIKHDTEHDVEFATIPTPDGESVRLILRIDGQIIFDHIDSTSPLTNAGYAAIHNSGIVGLEMYAPKQQSYPSLVELLNDPNSELNKKQ